MHFLDYQRIGTPMDKKKVLPRDPKELLSSAIFRCCQIIKYHYKKDNPFRELIMELKRLEQTEESQAMFRMKELVKSVAPIIISKIKKLIANRV